MNRKDSADIRLVGLTLLKYHYPHENEYLQNNFQSTFHLPKEYRILTAKSEYGFPVTSQEGVFQAQVPHQISYHQGA